MMQVLPPCGHAVQEDKPEKVRKLIISLKLFFLKIMFGIANISNQHGPMLMSKL